MVIPRHVPTRSNTPIALPYLLRYPHGTVTPPRPPTHPVPDGLPRHVRLAPDDIRSVVTLHDAWRVGNRWWRGEPATWHVLVDLEGGITAEVYREDGPASPHGTPWRIERLLD